ncbi:MAG: SDR family oxidoreductase, partial [Actinomycetota bacterium]|nr:SDR family oxidoreductase [Actinomycetota bacterium]
CVVTGASRGIGMATARMLAAEGASVLLVARSAQRLEAAELECAGPGGAVASLAVDVTDPEAAEQVMETCEERFGKVDVLVNNAGTSEAKPLEQLTDVDWQLQWELHVMASMRLMRAAGARMGDDARIVNVCSSSGKRPSLTNPAYSVTKAAQLSLSRIFADAYARKGVLVNAVTPGPVATGLWMDEGGLADQVAKARGITREEALEAAQGKIPLGRFGTEDEIAAVVTFLCSGRASNVTGAAWSVDGGAVPVIL